MIERQSPDANTGCGAFADSSATPAFTRRTLMAACGLSAGATLLPSAVAHAQARFDIEPVGLPLSQELFAADSFSFSHRWLSTLDLSESYVQKHGEARQGDRGTLDAMGRYLRGALPQRVRDVSRLSDLVVERPERFQQAALRSIEQSPIEGRLKEEALNAIQRDGIADRATRSRERAGELLNGIQTSLEERSERVGVPHIEDAELRNSWICTLLNSMLTSALASGQWYAVASLIVRMKLANCLR